MTKSLRPPPPDPDLELSVETATNLITEIGTSLERLRWFLWHGNVFRALQTVTDITADLEILNPDGEPTKLLKAVREFDSYLRANTGRIPNYGERRRAGEAISTAFVESTVNQVISK
ncbi:MAG: ISKra4 family transposase, partial [Pseudonocardiales bacterium]